MEYYQSLIPLRKEKYPIGTILAILSHLKGEKIGEAYVKFPVQRHGLTKRLRPSHSNRQHFPLLLHPTTILLNTYLQQFLSHGTPCLAIKKNSEAIPKSKKQLEESEKHQNQTGQRCKNNQTGNLKQL